MNTISHDAQPRFEQVYPRAPFAELIRLGLTLAGGLVKLRARLTGTTRGGEISQAAAR